MKQSLMDTKDKIIVEASPYDKIWGIGLGVDNPDALDISKWQGSNWLGIAIMQVRGRILSDAQFENRRLMYRFGPDTIVGKP
jgi:ribA/ribD-fused uncharacterized protein